MTIADITSFFEAHGHRLIEYSYDGDIDENTDPLPEDTRIVMYVRSADEYQRRFDGLPSQLRPHAMG